MDFYSSDSVRRRPLKSKMAAVNETSEKKADRYEALANRLLVEVGESSVRASRFLSALQASGVQLRDLSEAVFAPRVVADLKAFKGQVSRLAIQEKWLCPFLVALRGDRTLAETAALLGLGTASSYHHWESGRRDIPLAHWLRAIDLLSGRLEAMLATIAVPFDIGDLGFKKVAPHLYSLFFADPWTPTVLTALRLPDVASGPSMSHQIDRISRKTGVLRDAVVGSLDTLVRLRLVEIRQAKFHANPSQFYAIPSLSSGQIERIHRYWFSRSVEMLERPGFHKVEQHALTHESKEKIVGWIAELRERIRAEVKSSGDPETLIHIGWQLAEFV